MEKEYDTQTSAQNKYGEWVPAIPWPYMRRFRYICPCGTGFWTMEGFRGHYALKHILGL